LASIILKNRRLFAVILIGVIVVTGVAGAEVFVSFSAQTMLAQADIRVAGVEVLDTSSNTLDLNLTMGVSPPLGFTVIVGSAELAVDYEGSSLGTLDFPGTTVYPGQNNAYAQCLLTVTSTDTLTQFLEAFVTSYEPEVGVQGTVTLQAIIGFGVVTSLTMDKPVKVAGMGGLAGSQITGLQLLNATEDTLAFRVNATLANPTKISATLSGVSADLFYKGSLLGNITVGDVNLQPGGVPVEAEGILNPDNLTAVQEMVTIFVSGQPCNLDLNLTADSIIPGLVEDVTLKTTLQTELPGLVDVEAYLNEMELISVADNSATMELNISIWNPSPVTGWLPELLFDLSYQGTVVGSFTLPSMLFLQGNNSYLFETTFTEGNSTALKAMMTPYLSGTDIDVELKGSPQGNLLSILVAGWSNTFTLESPGALSVDVHEIWLINSSTSSIFLGANVSFFNPTSISLNLTQVQFNSWVNTTGYIGTINLANLQITGGWNNISVEFEVASSNTTLLTEIVNRYMDGKNISIHLEGISFGNVLGTIIGSLAFDIEIAGVEPLDIAVISMMLLNASSTSAVLNSTVQISNPTQENVNLDNLNFSIYYQGQLLGNLSLPEIEVLRGIHLYILVSNFTIANNTLLDELLTNYFKGVQISLHIVGIPGGSDILSRALSGYDTWIVLPSLDLETSIISIEFVDATADTLDLTANMSLTNPSAMNITLNSLNVTLFYEGSEIGNATIGNVELVPGLNYVLANISLTKAYNETAISKLLSGYMVGESNTVAIEGEFDGDLNGLISMTSVEFAAATTLEGIQQEIIQGITILSVIVELSTMGFTVNARATVYNPLTFQINVTMMSTMMTMTESP